MAKPEKHVWRPRNHGRRRKSRHRFKVGRHEIALFLALAMGAAIPALLWTPNVRERNGGRFDDGTALLTSDGVRAVAPHEGGSLVMSVVSRANAPRLLVVFLDPKGGRRIAPATLLSFARSDRDRAHISFSAVPEGLLSDKPVPRLTPGASLTVTGSHFHRYVVRVPPVGRIAPKSKI